MQDITNYNYFDSRAQAGIALADLVQKYRYEDTIVLSLSPGGVLVGAEIARRVHSLIAMLLTEDIYLPDGRTMVGVVNELGGFIHNNAFSAGEIDEFESEYRNYIDQAKMEAFHKLHVAIGQGGEISPEYFRDRVVFAVTDGAMSGSSFDMSYEFLKGIHYKKLVMMSPLASVEAVDRMHLLADELFCLSVKPGTFEVDHYYEDNELPSKDQTIEILENIIMQWHSVERLETNDAISSGGSRQPLDYTA